MKSNNHAHGGQAPRRSRAPFSCIVTAAVKAVERGQITHADYVVLGVLASYANSERRCFPSLSTIATKARLHRGSAKRSIARLAAAGLIKVEAGKNAKGGQSSNSYELLEGESPLARHGTRPRRATVPAPGAPAHPKLDPVEARSKLKTEQFGFLKSCNGGKDSAAVQSLFDEAVRAQLVDDSEAARLRFFAAAVFALRKGRNPQKLLAWILKNRAWDRPTAADEDAAQALIGELDAAGEEADDDGLPEVRTPPAELTLGEIELRRRELRRQLAEAVAQEEDEDHDDAERRRAAC